MRVSKENIMQAEATNKYTSIPLFPADQYETVSGYSKENEELRQALANNSWRNSTDADFKKKAEIIDAHFKAMIIRVTDSKSPTYDGGLWEFNEHGLLSLSTDKEKHECMSAFRMHTINTEELSYAMSAMSANFLTWDEKMPNWEREFFTYLFHFSYCLMDEANSPEKFDTSVVYSILD